MKEIDYQRMIDTYRRDLSYRHDFTVSAAYDAMDARAPRGRIDRYEVSDFVRDYYTYMSEAELDAVIRRCDTDEDECLSYNEFSDVVRV